MSFVQVALNVPARQTFTYRVPEGMDLFAAVGKRVLVPLGRRRLTGYIVGILTVPDCDSVRDVLEILDEDPLFSREDFLFYAWIAYYYLYPVGRALGEILPGSIPARDRTRVTLNRGIPPADAGTIPPPKERILQLLRECPRGLTVKRLKEMVMIREMAGLLEEMEDRGWIRISEGARGPAIRHRTERVLSLASGSPEGLSPRQEEAVRVLRGLGAVPAAEFSRILPGSGTILATLKKKGIVLVEERPLIHLPGLVPLIEGPRIDLSLSPDQASALEAVRSDLARDSASE